MFSPFAVGYANALPMFGDTRVGPLEFRVNEAGAETLPAATGGDLPLRYALESTTLSARLNYVPLSDPIATGGVIAGTPTVETAAWTYTLTATDGDGDAATLAFMLDVVRTPLRVRITDATAVGGRAVEFVMTVSQAVAAQLTLDWTSGRSGSATPGEDYEPVTAGQVRLEAGAREGRWRCRCWRIGGWSRPRRLR